MMDTDSRDGVRPTNFSVSHEQYPVQIGIVGSEDKQRILEVVIDDGVDANHLVGALRGSGYTG